MNRPKYLISRYTRMATELARSVHKGDELLLRTALGHLDTYTVSHVSAKGAELAWNRYSLPVWATTWIGLARATDTV